MYHDSDDEPLSGDDEQSFRDGYAVASSKRRKKTMPKKPFGGGKYSNYRDVEKKGASLSPPAAPAGGLADKYHRDGVDGGHGHRRKYAFKGYNIYPVIVVDYDLTLVDRSSRPFPGSHEFIEKLREFNDGQLQLILYSHGSPAYIQDGLNKHFARERRYFDEIISDNSARNNKPVTHVRRLIRKLEYLIGPYVIIDDMRSNLDEDQYDIVIDITRLTSYGETGKAVSVDYASCLCLVEQQVQTFLKTKKSAP